VAFLVAGLEVGGGPSLPIVVGTLYFLLPYDVLWRGLGSLFATRDRPAATASREATWLAVALTSVPFLVVLGLLAPLAGLLAVMLAGAPALSLADPAVQGRARPVIGPALAASRLVLPALAGCLVAGAAASAVPWPALVALAGWAIATEALRTITTVTRDRASGRASLATELGAGRTAMVALVGYAVPVAMGLAAGGLAAVAAAALASFLLLPATVLSVPSGDRAGFAWRQLPGIGALTGTVLLVLLAVHWDILPGSPADALLAAALGGAGICVAQLGANAWTARGARRRALDRAATVQPRLPRLAVVVAAHDDAARLPGLVAALAAQDHPDLEMVVVDAGSTDGTAETARFALARARAGWRDRDAVVVAPRNEHGPVDRRTARSIGLGAATADHVVFLDPDTLPRPDALRTLHEVAIVSKAGIVTGLPGEAMPSPAEQAFGPAFSMTVAGLVPLWAFAMRGGRDASLAYADASLVLVDRAAYVAAEASGPSSSGSSRSDEPPWDGMSIARSIAGLGREVRVITAGDLVVARRFADGGDALGAWRRSSTDLASGSFATLLALVGAMTAAWILPILAPIVGYLTGDRRILLVGLLALGLLVAFRVGLALYVRQPLIAAVWHPVTAFAVIGAQVAGLADAVLGSAAERAGAASSVAVGPQPVEVPVTPADLGRRRRQAAAMRPTEHDAAGAAAEPVRRPRSSAGGGRPRASG
jgi:4-hydroxybenzoate polyprenyltransferase